MSIELNDWDSSYPTTSGVQQPGYNMDIAKKDSCTCYTRKGMHGRSVYAYTGMDCSIRTCPHGKAYAADGLIGNDDHNMYLECSGRGTCDGKTGECACQPGYEGAACERAFCGGMLGDNNQPCAGRGRCLTQRQIAEDVKDAATSTSANPNGLFYISTQLDATQYETAWDAEKSMGCWCDSGFRGPDCSEKECPSAADPMNGKGSESGRTCSGRGTCVDGPCECVAGYTGSACQENSALVM